MIKNSKIRALVVDSDPSTQKRIANLLNEIDNILLINQALNGEDAIKSIVDNTPDIIFIDTYLSDMSGFDVISSLPNSINPLLIFITDQERFALKAFEYSAFDYLLKPFKDDRFINSAKRAIDSLNQDESIITSKKINQLFDLINNENFQSPIKEHKKLLFKYNGTILLLKACNINYILASGSYAEIYTSDKKYLLRESLNSLIKKLPDDTFYRIHRSTIINLDLIEEVSIATHGEIQVKMVNDESFRVSQSNRMNFFKQIGLKNYA